MDGLVFLEDRYEEDYPELFTASSSLPSQTLNPTPTPASTTTAKPTSTVTQPPSSPEPTTEPEPEPEPDLTEVFVIVARELLVVSGRQPLLTWSFEGYSVKIEDEASTQYCSQQDLVHKAEGNSEPPRFPERLGSFDLLGHKDCQYTGGSDSVGVVQCSDGYKAKCEAYPEDDPVLDCTVPNTQTSRDNYYFRVRCQYAE